MPQPKQYSGPGPFADVPAAIAAMKAELEATFLEQLNGDWDCSNGEGFNVNGVLFNRLKCLYELCAAIAAAAPTAPPDPLVVSTHAANADGAGYSDGDIIGVLDDGSFFNLTTGVAIAAAPDGEHLGENEVETSDVICYVASTNPAAGIAQGQAIEIVTFYDDEQNVIAIRYFNLTTRVALTPGQIAALAPGDLGDHNPSDDAPTWSVPAENFLPVDDTVDQPFAASTVNSMTVTNNGPDNIYFSVGGFVVDADNDRGHVIKPCQSFELEGNSEVQAFRVATKTGEGAELFYSAGNLETHRGAY